jgi:hypothetical protein
MTSVQPLGDRMLTVDSIRRLDHLAILIAYRLAALLQSNPLPS